MASVPRKEEEAGEVEEAKKLYTSFLGIGFVIFLGSLPKSAICRMSHLETRNRELFHKLSAAEEQLRQMRSRRKEDSKANARVVEIFASQRNSWQQEVKRLLIQIDASAQEISHLRARLADFEKSSVELQHRVDDLSREVGERDEMINFMSRKHDYGEDFHDNGDNELGEYAESREGFVDFRRIRHSEEENCVEMRREEEPVRVSYAGYNHELIATASRLWAERASLWQDESFESLYPMKHFIPRRESPWKIDGETTGVSSKLRLLEQELLNLEKLGVNDLSKVSSLMRKQANRYQGLAGKIEDLCKRMQASDPCDPALSSEFRTKRQTEFLLEAVRLQQRASDSAQKLMALQAETGKCYIRNEVEDQAKLTPRRPLDSIRNNFKEIQRNFEIWLARIIGDLEGVLATDGAPHVREYYISRYPFIQ